MIIPRSGGVRRVSVVLLRREKGGWLPCWLLAWAWVVGLHAVLLWIAHHPRTRGLNGDEVTYWQAAREILAGQTPAINLLWPPLYPRFLAAILQLWDSLGAVILVQTLLLVGAAVCLAGVARQLGASPKTAHGIALAFLGYPPLAAFAHYLWPEVLHLALFLAALWIVLARPQAVGWMPLVGLLLGLALLSKSLLTYFWPLLLIPVLQAPGTRGQRTLRASLVVAALLLTVTPTVLHHQRATGRWVIADSSAFNLWVGLSLHSRQSLGDAQVYAAYLAYLDSAPTWPERDQLLWQRIRGLLAERGWAAVLKDQLAYQYFRLFDRQSYLSAQLPGGELTRGERGYQETPTWLAGLLRTLCDIATVGLWLAFAWGIWVVPPRRRPGGWLLVAFNSALFIALRTRGRSGAAAAGTLLLLALANEGYGLLRIRRVDRELEGEPGFRVGLVQGALAGKGRQGPAALETQNRLSDEVLSEGQLDVNAWPESSFGYPI